MLILPDRNIPRAKVLLPMAARAWRTPSQGQPKNSLGLENQVRFSATARLDDGRIVWRGWFDDRDDFDAFIFALVTGSLVHERELWRLPTPWWHPDIDAPLGYEFITSNFLIGGTTYNIPADCVGISGQSGEFIDVIGISGRGANAAATVTGGGGGAWSRITVLPLTPNGTANTLFATTSTDTWFNKTANVAPTLITDGVLAKPGANGNSSGTAAAGGLASGCVGASKNDGGSSGTAASHASGGGGAAGPNGAGVSAANATAANTAGGNGDNGSGGPGSAGSAGASSLDGSPGQEYDAIHGSGGGSGGGAVNSGNGGNFGAGSGGAVSTTPGARGPPLIVVAYAPFTPLSGLIWATRPRRTLVIGY